MSNPSTPRAHNPATSNPFEVNRRVLASDLTLAAKAVLIVILDHARYGASRCTATTKTIAREARVTGRTVRNVLPELEARRLIRVERATGSKCSRHTIRVGPCIHQVGNPFPLRLHEGGNEFHEGGNPRPHEGGNGFPQKRQEKGDIEDGSSTSIGEGIDPWTVRWFGPPSRGEGVGGEDVGDPPRGPRPAR